MFARLRSDELWGNGEFRAFVAANVIERFAASAISVMLAFHIYDVRKDPLDLALIGFVQVLPAITLSLIGGDVADRTSRRRMVLLTTLGLTLLCAALSFVSVLPLPPGLLVGTLLAASFLSACIRSIETPAAVGLEAQVLPVHLVLRGVPILSTSARVADMAGPVGIGFVWAAGGPLATYATLCVLFGASCVTFLLGVAEKPVIVRGDGLGVVRRISEGVRYVFGNQILIGSMALDLFAVFFGGAAALLPIFASDILQVGPSGFGLLRTAIAAGAFTAAAISLRVMPKAEAGLALHLVIASFGISMIVFGLSTSFLLSLAALYVAGICDGFSMVIRHAIVRLASPEHMRGRIAAVRMVFVSCSNELGAVQSGLSASLLGPAHAVMLGGVFTIGVVAAVAWRMPVLRQLDLGTYGIAKAKTA